MSSLQSIQLEQDPRGNAGLLPVQKQALEQFDRLGLPTVKHEEWKYTSLRPLSTVRFQLGHEKKALAALPFESILLKVEASQLVFINGVFSAENSSLKKEEHAIICSLKEAREKHAALFEAHFGKYAVLENEPLNAMNMALTGDGAFIYVPKGKTASFPVIINHVTDSRDATVLSQPRNLIVVEEGASIRVVESYTAAGSNEMYVGLNASLDHYKVQRQTGETYHNNFTQMKQEANTNINQVTLTLDGKLVRNNLHFYMNGEHCNTLLYGLFLSEKENHIDNHTRVDHAKPNCYSNELYKGIMKDKSTGVFNGKIIVHLDAQKTNAYQRNQNVLLSNEATINTKPQLEIFADDVKCTHGATIGQLDDKPVFYLRSRGIPEQEARKMLLNAFADEIAEMIRIPELVQILEQEIEAKL
jgi:Fe-S cluster assembly protein SufD